MSIIVQTFLVIIDCFNGCLNIIKKQIIIKMYNNILSN